MTNEQIIAEFHTDLKRSGKMQDALQNLCNKARAEGYEKGKEINSEVRNIWQKNGYEAGRQSAITELNNNRLTKKAYEDAAIVAQEEIDELNRTVEFLNKLLAERAAEKQEQVRELENRIEGQLKALENNLTGKISDKYLKGAIDAYNDLKLQLPQIFPSCAEQPHKSMPEQVSELCKKIKPLSKESIKELDEMLEKIDSDQTEQPKEVLK